jgi:hypothetical protein
MWQNLAGFSEFSRIWQKWQIAVDRGNLQSYSNSSSSPGRTWQNLADVYGLAEFGRIWQNSTAWQSLAEFGRIPQPGRTWQNLADAADCRRLWQIAVSCSISTC